MFLATEEEVCILSNMFCGIKSISFKIKILIFFFFLTFFKKENDKLLHHKLACRAWKRV